MLDDPSSPKQGASDRQQEPPLSQGNTESSIAPLSIPDQDDAWQQRIFVELHHTIEGMRRRLATSDGDMTTASQFHTSADVLNVELHELDSALPHQTFGEVLVACEALALVSGPSALVSGDVKTLHSQSRGLQATMLGILRASQAGSTQHHSDTPPASAVHDTFVASLRQQAMVADLLRMTELLGALAADTPSIAGLQVAAMPQRSLAPIFIVGLAIALIVFLAGSILIATSRIPPMQHSRNTGANVAGNPIDSPTPKPISTLTAGTTPTVTGNGQPPAPTATGNGQPPAPTATGNGQPPTPTATGNGQPPAPTATGNGQPPAPTATPVPPPPPPPTQAPAINVSLSPQSLQLCPDNDVTIAYNSGNGVITWTMTVSDSTNIGVHDVDGAPYNPSVSGQLAPGQSVDVAVKALNDGNFTGILTLHIPGIHDQYVSYQTNCLSSGN